MSGGLGAGAQAELETEAARVRAFLLGLHPDPVHGRDELEKLFRSFYTYSRSAPGSGAMEEEEEEVVGMYSAWDSGSGSGGYAEMIFRYAAERLFGVDLGDQPLPYVMGRNPDIAEVDIESFAIETFPSDNGETVKKRKLKIGRAYGFRNIQSVILKLKRGKCDLDLIEVMACPSGCNNGGGQLKITDNHSADRGTSATTARERLSRVEDIFHCVRKRKPEDSPLVRYLYCERRLGSPFSERAKSLLHTSYHAVPKLELIAPLAVKW